jgi:hypothetical protein
MQGITLSINTIILNCYVACSIPLIPKDNPRLSEKVQKAASIAAFFERKIFYDYKRMISSCVSNLF